MTEFLYFLGRFHVLVLHLPIGILGLAVVLELAARRERFRYLAPAVSAVWLLGAISAAFTVALGYLHAREGGFDGAAVNAHRLAGTSLAVLAAATWVVRSRFESLYARLWPVCSLAVAALLILTGHFGGNLTHGDTYLAQHAPGPLRQLMGVSEESVPRPRPKNLASADLYLDVVAPAFQQRCASCHNDGKRKGGLSLARYAQVMKGGEKGPVIVPGKPQTSDLVRRITLPASDSDFMPHDGKTPLTAEQTAAIRWWVEIGAPKSALVSAFTPTPPVAAALETALGLRKPIGIGTAVAAAGAFDSTAGGTPEAPDATGIASPAPAALNALEGDGFTVRALSADSPLVQVDYTASHPVTDKQIDLLAAIAPQIYKLNLRAAGLTNTQLESLSRFRNMAVLRIELNPITDAGLGKLGGLEKLQSLNLYGTRISDAGLASLATLRNLRELFLWQTAVTPAGVAEFERAHTGVRVVGGFDPRTFPEGPKVIPVVN